ncbi:MAG: Tfp pilus assembly protein PilX [Rhodocyclales bacterium]|nr:Tfp pilus assembly protein PilX [Rhodocyclales bacterium]
MKTRRHSLPSCRNLHSREQGLTLVVVLVFLVMLTLIGATSMQAAGVEERMASNGRDKSIAFEAAETALRIGEEAAKTANTATDFKSTCENGLCTTGNAPDPNTYAKWANSRLDATNLHFGIDRTDLTKRLPSNLAYDPGYFAEYLGTMDVGSGLTGKKVIRVTAHAPGRDPNTQVTLQSVIYQ